MIISLTVVAGFIGVMTVDLGNKNAIEFSQTKKREDHSTLR